MRIKKIFSAILALILILSVCSIFAACNNDQGGHEITFDANGGVLDSRTQRVEVGDKINLPAVSRDGYTLNCWVYIVGDKLNIINDQDEFNFRSSVSFKAMWIPDGAYAIKYDLGGGSMSVGNPFYYTTASNTINLVSPEKQGYSFVGWSGTGLDGIESLVTIKKGSTGHKEYKANYFTEYYKVSLVLTCAALNPTSEKMETVQCLYNGQNKFVIEDVKYNTAITLNAPSLINDEYYFDYWYYIKDGQEVKFVNAGEVGATVFNMFNFDEKEVKIYVKCLAGWTKDY
jgi:uncharacterized repeat protein (TIGR02543 family)